MCVCVCVQMKGSVNHEEGVTREYLVMITSYMVFKTSEQLS